VATPLTLEDKIANEATLTADAEAQAEQPVFNPKSEVELTRSQELAVATGDPVDIIHSEREVGDPNPTVKAKTESTNYSEEVVIQQAYEDNLDPTDVASVIQERRAKGQDMNIGEYLLLQNLMLDDNQVNSYAARTLTNMDIWNKLMQQEFEANDQSGFSKLLSFLDVNVLREMTIGAVENVTFRSNREGQDIRSAFNTMQPSEFQEWAKDYIAERKAEGIFSEDSVWNLYKAANDATYLGDDPLALLNAAFGAVDITTLGGFGAAKGLKAATAAGEAGADVASKVVGLARVRRPVDTVAVMVDEVEAGVVASRLVDDVGVQTDVVNAGRTLSKDMDPVPGPVSRPAGPAVRQTTRKNAIVEKLEEFNRRGSFGEYIPMDTLKAVSVRIADQIAERTNDVVVNTFRVVDEGSDDFKVVVRMGKDGSGAPFRRKVDAEAIAAQDPSLTVVKREEGRGWYVQAEQRVNVLGLPEAAEVVQKPGIISDAVNKVFGAATVRLGDKLGAKFMQAEAGSALVGDLIKPYAKKINKLKGKELEKLSDFMTQLRDGELSHLRQAPDRQSFESMYKTMYGEKPSTDTLDAYDALVDINDASWHIKSSERLKRVVAEGGVHVQITDEFGDIAYRVDGQRVRIPEDELIFDPVSNRSFKRDELSPDQVVYKVPNTFVDHLFVTNVKSSRVLERVDVMPYNIGGPRTNAEFRWFVGATREQTLASGNKISGGFRTVLGSFGKQQAETAVRELNAIGAKLRQLMKDSGYSRIEDLSLSKADYDELGDVIRANNSWNKHITDFEDLQAFAAKYRLNFKEDFVGKARDQKVSIREAGEDPAAVGASFGEVVGTRLNMRRGDTPPMEFGGKMATNASPIANIADQFGSEVFGYANRAASQNAIVGWVKLAQKSGVVEFPSGVATNDYLNQFLGAKVAKTGKYNDLAAQLREQQDVIKRRLNQPTWMSDRWEGFANSVTEFIFEKTGKKLDINAADPGGELLKVGFYSKFGFFNPDQFVLQGLHSLTIAAISPKQGIKALGLTTPMMAIASIKNPAARKLAIQRLAKIAPMSEEELTTLVRYIDESGRNIIDNQVIELQAPQKFGAASTLTGKAKQNLGRFLDTSTLFFKEGDRVTRMAGITTAFLEHRARFPKIDPLSPEGKAWITNREQDLTFRMTTQSRSMIQSGPMRVPTQWLTFSFRAMENIVVGRNFTTAERTRMALAMGPMFGLVGVGGGSMAGYITEKLGYDMNNEDAVKFHNRIKYGIIDTILSEAIGVDTAYAVRVAPIDQVFDTYKKLFSDEFMTVLLGPSGEIGGGMLAVTANAFKAMFGGKTEFVRDDLTQLVRNLSTVDKIYKINELIETGNYRSRTHKTAVQGLPPEAAAAVLFGATPAPVQNFYDYQEMVYKKNQTYRDIRTRVQEKARLALDLLTNGNEDDMIRGTELWQQINDTIWSSPLSTELKTSLQKSIVNAGNVKDIMRNALRLDLGPEAQLLQQQIQ
jgi:hypothetical protein